VLLDARTQSEFDISHLAGASRVDPDSDELDPAPVLGETLVVVYCSVGYRSAAVARRLDAAGFRHVYNLEGGIFQWANEGRAVYRGGKRVEEVHPYNRAWGRLLDAGLHPGS
jgi:rhodanese-related sulfurtransferase